MFEIYIPKKFQIYSQVTAIVADAASGEYKNVIKGHNLVTNDGDYFYAVRAVAGTPSTDYFCNGSGVFDGVVELYIGATASPSKAAVRSSIGGTLVSWSSGPAISEMAMSSGYPKVNDSDSGNTGKGADVVTYKVTYTTSEANGTSISDVVITNPSPSSGDKLLMWSELTPFNKTSSDTLTIYINHTFTGA